MDQQSNGYRNGNLQQTGQNRGRVLFEHRRDHQSEDRQHNGQGQKQHQQKQHPHPAVQHAARDISHRLTVVAQAHHQRSQIMHRADKYTAQHHPDQRRQPSPHDGDRGADNRTRARNAGEVMSKNHARTGRAVIDIVPEFFRRTLGLGRQVEDFSAHPAAVRHIRKNKRRGSADSNQ